MRQVIQSNRRQPKLAAIENSGVPAAQARVVRRYDLAHWRHAQRPIGVNQAQQREYGACALLPSWPPHNRARHPGWSSSPSVNPGSPPMAACCVLPSAVSVGAAGRGCGVRYHHAATDESSDKQPPTRVNRAELIATPRPNARHTRLHLRSRVVNTCKDGLRASAVEPEARADSTRHRLSLSGMFFSYPLPNRFTGGLSTFSTRSKAFKRLFIVSQSWRCHTTTHPSRRDA
jgi:hypothetical protein